MEFFDAVAKRHSYRGAFTDDPVPREDLRRIVEAGLLAPTAKNAQTTSFVIVDDGAKVAAIAALPGSKAMQQAKAYIVCIVDANPVAVYEGFAFQVEDCAAAVENMLLAVTALGYATVWVDGWLRIGGHAGMIAEWLGIPPEKQVRVILPIGRPAHEVVSRVEKQSFEQRAWFNEFGGGCQSGAGEGRINL